LHSVNKKYFPYLILLFAAILLFWVKKNQRGQTGRVTVQNATEAYTDLKSGNKTIVYSRHAKCRMYCRHIDESEVKEILQQGEVNFNKIQKGDKGATYPVEGTTHDGQHVRIVFAAHEQDVVVVTVIDLDTDWKCNCN
jgi:acetylornithine deacetylase/succinyl-diaminopimelate desuccinylase-like protein